MVVGNLGLVINSGHGLTIFTVAVFTVSVCEYLYMLPQEVRSTRNRMIHNTVETDN